MFANNARHLKIVVQKDVSHVPATQYVLNVNPDFNSRQSAAKDGQYVQIQIVKQKSTIIVYIINLSHIIIPMECIRRIQ